METHKLEFKQDELNIVLLGLQKLPWETSNALIQNIVQQIQPKPKKDVSKGN